MVRTLFFCTPQNIKIELLELRLPPQLIYTSLDLGRHLDPLRSALTRGSDGKIYAGAALEILVP